MRALTDRAGVVLRQHLQADEISDAHVDERPNHGIHPLRQAAVFDKSGHIPLGIEIVILQKQVAVDIQRLENKVVAGGVFIGKADELHDIAHLHIHGVAGDLPRAGVQIALQTAGKALHDVDIELVLAAEINIKCAHGQSGTPGYILDGGVAVALLAEAVLRRLHQFVKAAAALLALGDHYHKIQFAVHRPCSFFSHIKTYI